MRTVFAVLIVLATSTATLTSAVAGSDPYVEELTRRILVGRYYLVGISDGFINQYTSRIRFFQQGDNLMAKAQSGVPESYRLGVTDLSLNYPNLYFTMIATDPKGRLLAIRDCQAKVSGDPNRMPYTCIFMIGPEQAKVAPQTGELVRDIGQAVVTFQDEPAGGCFLSALRRQP